MLFSVSDCLFLPIFWVSLCAIISRKELWSRIFIGYILQRERVFMIAFCQIENLLKAYFFALKGRFFADELGIIKIRALGDFWGTNGKSRWHSGGRLRRLWRNLGKMGRKCSLAV